MSIQFPEMVREWMGWCPNAGVAKTKWSSNTVQDFSVEGRRMESPPASGAGRQGMAYQGKYKHTQRGDMIIGLFAAVILLLLAMIILEGFEWVVLIVLGIMCGVLLVCSELTVTVDERELRIQFGPVGLIRKSWSLDEIESVNPVNNPWYYGIGIHWTPRGVLYNVSGFRGVEVRLYSGTLFRIGTDEPEVLCRAIGLAGSEKNTLAELRGYHDE
jgi:hypothetical protein